MGHAGDSPARRPDQLGGAQPYTDPQCAQSAPADRASGTAGTTWTVDELLDVLCEKDPAVVAKLSNTNVTIADDIYYDDLYYDATTNQWYVDRFYGGGSWTGGNIQILLMLSQGTPENAAVTAYHELVHKGQSDTMSTQDKELEAYSNETTWAIAHGLPASDDLCSQTPGGRAPDQAKIKKFIDDNYPIPDLAPGEAEPVAINRDGTVLLSDNSSRAPRQGDCIPGPEVTDPDPPRTVPPSAWKCPDA